jgi:thiaminase/transcriptional activator TenA
MSKDLLSDRILRTNAGTLQTMLDHRFVSDVKNDTLSTETFERYLVYEAAFVDTAISIFAHAVTKAETIEQKRWLIAVLDALANEQIAYFERTFVDRRIDPAAFKVTVPAVANFRSGMLTIAQNGGFLDIVTAMFAAEWMYWTWSKQAGGGRVSDPLLKEWVELHVHKAFADQALWLKHQIDTAGDNLDEAEQVRLEQIFERAMELEIDFHHAAYADGAEASGCAPM